MTEVGPRLADITTSLKNAKTSLPTVESLSDTSDGISLLSLKTQLLLSYLQHVSFYMILKLRGERIDEGEFKNVINQLIDLRVYLDKGIKPIESKLRYQIDKVLRSAERMDREGDLNTLDETARDALAYKPNPSSLIIDKPSHAAAAGDEDIEDVNGDGIYRPPRIAATLPAREAAGGKRRQPNATLREFVDAELSAAPVAEPSIGSNIITQGRQGNSIMQSSRDRAAQSERDRYEEENYIRLPSTGKQKKGGRRNDDVYGGEDFRILDEELYDFGKGKKTSLVERSRKRGQEDGQEDGVQHASTGKFKKRKKLLAGRARGKK